MELLTTREAAREMEAHPNSLRGWVDHGRVPRCGCRRDTVDRRQKLSSG